MSDNFKYDDYDEQDFQMNNTSNVKTQHKSLQQPQTIKLLGRQQKKETETQLKTNNDNSTKSKLIEQHIKLKSQLKELASKMDEILQKQRQRKKKKLQGHGDDDDQRVIQMKKKLKQQQIKMQKIRNDIIKLRKNMDSKYDMNRIVDKQNQLKHLQKQLETLEQQKKSLQKIRKTQDKAIHNEEDKQSKNKKLRMEQELRQVTAQTKKQLETINEKEKQVRRLHESYIMKVQKAKQIQAKLNDKKKSNQGDQITPEAISRLEKELKQIQQQKAVIQKQGNQKMRAIQKQRKQLKNQMQRKKLILEQKQKQLRLNQMKHKQVIRLINSSQQQQPSVAESRVEKQNKGQSKRVVPKKGRQAPNLQVQGQQQQVEEQTKKQLKQESKTVSMKSEKHEYGFTANLDDEGIIDD